MLVKLVHQAISLLSQSVNGLTIFVVTFALVYAFLYARKRSTSAPRPRHITSFPLIGSLPVLPDFTRWHTFFMDKMATMGPIVGFSILTQESVILQTREAIAEAFAKADVSSRPYKWFRGNLSRYSNKGFFVKIYDTEFKKYHQLTLSVLKEFGFGKLGGVMESRIQGEVADLVTELRSSQEQPIDPEVSVESTVMNVIASILFGKKFDKRDHHVRTFLTYNSQWNITSASAMPVVLKPALRHVSHFKRLIIDFENTFIAYEKALQGLISECVCDETLSPSFIRSYIETLKGENCDKLQLVCTLRDLMFAGSETSASTIRFAIAALANHQDIQKRLQAEIDSVVRKERLPSLSDQSQLTYVEAFILEVLRRYTVVPLGVSHETSKDVVIQGFAIPNNTIVVSNIYAVHMDPKSWEDPTTFRPERFINDEGRIFNREKVIAFSVGKRSCLGEVMARQEIFLFITGLIQNFTILPPEGHGTVEFDELVASTVKASPYKVRFVQRTVRGV